MSGGRDGSLLKAIDRTVTGAGARLLADRLMSPLTDPEGDQRAAGFGGVLRLRDAACEALRAALKGAADMPRALTRLALNRGGPRDLGALRAGFEAALQLADAVCRRRPAGRTRGGAGRDRGAADTLRRSSRARRSPTNCRCSSATAVSCARATTRELDEMRALRDEARKVIAGDGARADRGDRHPLAEDPAQQRARLLHRGDRQPSGRS